MLFDKWGLEEVRGLGAFSHKEKGAVNVCIALSRNVQMTRPGTQVYSDSGHSGITPSSVLEEYMVGDILVGYKL